MADFMSFPTERERVLRSGDTTIGVIPDICLVSHFQVGDWPVLYRPMETGNVKRWGLPLMIPNFSRLKDGIFQEKGTTLPIHGFGRTLPWTIIAQSEQVLTMRLESSDATRPYYPYEFTFLATVSAGENSLTYTLEMQNRGDESMPIAPGFHPYFTIPQAQKNALITDGPAGFSAQDFDWVEHIPDNPYPFPRRITVQVPERGTLLIEEVPVADRYSLAEMQVWSEPPARPDHDFVCFEPIVSHEDALNRPADRLNIEAQGTRAIVLRIAAIVP